MDAMRRLRCRVRGVTSRWILGQRLRFLPLTSNVRLGNKQVLQRM